MLKYALIETGIVTDLRTDIADGWTEVPEGTAIGFVQYGGNLVPQSAAKFVLVRDGIVVQSQPYPGEDFLEAPLDVYCGFEYENGQFSAPLIDLAPLLIDVRNQKIHGGLTVAGIAIQSDDTTQARLHAVRYMADLNPAFTVQWKTENGYVTLDATTIVALSNAMMAHVQNCFNAEAIVLDQLETYETAAEMKAAFEIAYQAVSA